MSYIYYRIDIQKKKIYICFDEFNSKTWNESHTCLSRGTFESCLRSPEVSHSFLLISCASFGIPCGISYSSECLCLGAWIALQSILGYNFTLRLVCDEIAEFVENFLLLLGSQQQSVLGEQNSAGAGWKRVTSVELIYPLWLQHGEQIRHFNP